MESPAPPAPPASPPPPPPAAPSEPPARGRAPRFDPPNILWYFGAISATFAAYAVVGDTGPAHRGLWIFLVALAFLAAAAGLSAGALLLGYWVPAGVFATSAVALVPAAMYGFERLIGVWPKDPAAVDPVRHFQGFLFALLVVTAAAGLGAFWLVRFAFVLLPVAVAAALAVQVLLPVLVSDPNASDHMIALLLTGAAFVVLGMLLDARAHRRDAFWWHVVGLVAIANALVYYVGVNPYLAGRHNALWAWIAMLLIGAALLVAAFPVGRATWGVFGVAGLYAPALHYVDEISGSWRYPLLMAFVGVALVVVGALLDVAGPSWHQRLARPALRPRT